MAALNPKVDGFIRKTKQWQEELQKLRLIILDCGLTEDVKWRVPFYTLADANVVFLGRFKESCTLSFVKGVLMKDAKGILAKLGENTQSGRVVRFTNVQQIIELEPVLKAYIREAIEVEKSGLKVAFKKVADFAIPGELQAAFDGNPALKQAFSSLTPGRQRAYILHFSGAKQSKTRVSRIEKWTPHILRGKGIDDE